MAVTVSGLCAASLNAQITLANFQSIINSQNPVRYYTMDGSLGDSVTNDAANSMYEWGTNATSGFLTIKYTTDAWGNANSAIGQDELGAGVPAISPGRLGVDPLAFGLNMSSTGTNTISWLSRLTWNDDASGVRNIFEQANTDGTRMGLREDDDPAGLQLTAGGQGYTQWANFTDTRHPDDQWVFYALSWDNNAETINLYVGENGSLSKYSRSMDDDATAGTDTFGFSDGDILNNSDEVKWLTSFGNVGDDSMLDEVAVWDVVLSDAQINAQFAATPASVPEPATFALMFGLLALGGVMIRRRMSR